MVEHLSDDAVWRLNRGGHDPHKVYAAYAAAVAPQGPADRDPRQDGQGLRHGRGRRGPEHHPPGQEDGRGRAAASFRDRFELDDDRRAGPRHRVLQAARRQPRDASTCTSAARRSAATCRSAARRRRRSRSPSSRSSRASSRQAASARSRPRWRSCACSPRCCATRSSARASSRSSPTSRARSAWRACSASSGSSPGRPALRAGRSRPAHVLPRGEERADPRGGHQRAGRVLGWMAAGTSYSNHGVRDDPVLHLLLDVRLPARGRLRVGGGRHAHARASCSAARRAARRSTARASSTRTATATCWCRWCRTASPTTRRTTTSWS